jgi:hypothetical protein
MKLIGDPLCRAVGHTGEAWCCTLRTTHYSPLESQITSHHKGRSLLVICFVCVAFHAEIDWFALSLQNPSVTKSNLLCFCVSSQGRDSGLNSSGFGYRAVAGICEHCNEPYIYNTPVKPLGLNVNLLYVQDTLIVTKNRTWRWHTCRNMSS